MGESRKFHRRYHQRYRKIVIGGTLRRGVFETVFNKRNQMTYLFYSYALRKFNLKSYITHKTVIYTPPYVYYPLFRQKVIRVSGFSLQEHPSLDEGYRLIKDFFSKYLRTDSSTLILLSLFTLATYFYDKFSYFPLLNIRCPLFEQNEIIKKLANVLFRSAPDLDFRTPAHLRRFFIKFPVTSIYSNPKFFGKEFEEAIAGQTVNRHPGVGAPLPLVNSTFTPQVLVTNKCLSPKLEWFSIPIYVRNKEEQPSEEEVERLRATLTMLRFSRFQEVQVPVSVYENLTRVDQCLRILLSFYKPLKDYVQNSKLQLRIKKNVYKSYLLKYSYWPKRIARVLVVEGRRFQEQGKMKMSVYILHKKLKQEYPNFHYLTRSLGQFLRYSLLLPFQMNEQYIDLRKVDFEELESLFDIKIENPRGGLSKNPYFKELTAEIGYTFYGGTTS